MTFPIALRKGMYVSIVGILLFSINNTIIPLTLQNYSIVTNNQSTHDINILLLLDYQYGRSYFAIRQLLEVELYTT